MAVKFTTSNAPTTGSALAPNVLDFQAGTKQGDGSYVAVMHWDLLGTEMQADVQMLAPVDRSNWSGSQTFVRVPDGSGGYEYIGDPDRTDISGYPDDGFGARVHEGRVGLSGLTVPTTPELWRIIAASYNAAGVLNRDTEGHPTGPYVDLMTLAPTASPITPPPDQPVDGDFDAEVIANGRDDGIAGGTLKNVSEIQVDISARPLRTTYFSIWTYEGTSRPADPSLWRNEAKNIPMSLVGDTLYPFWVDRSYTADRTFQLTVTASSGPTIPPTSTSPMVEVIVTRVGAPAQPTGFSVTLYTSPPEPGPGTTSGRPSGAFKVSWTPPADKEYFAGVVEMIDTDPGGTPLSGAEWKLVGSSEGSGFDQRQLTPAEWWEAPTASDKILRLYSVSRSFDDAVPPQRIKNLVSPPTTSVLHIPASTGLDFSKVDGSTVGDGLEKDPVTGKPRVKRGATIDYDGSGNVIVKLAALDSTHLVNGSLGADLTKFASSARPVVITTGVPSLPSANYPAGSIIFNTSDGKLYRNVSGSWNRASDPADLIAGTIAVGVVYAGAVNVSQLIAGTALFTGDVQFVRFGSSSSVTISSTGVTIQQGQLFLTKNGVTTTINNVADGSDFAGVKVHNDTSNSYTTMATSGFVVYSPLGPFGDTALASMSGPGRVTGRLRLTSSDQNSSVTCDSTSGSPRITLASAGFSNVVISMQSVAAPSFNPIVAGFARTGFSGSKRYGITCPPGGFVPGNLYWIGIFDGSSWWSGETDAGGASIGVF